MQIHPVMAIPKFYLEGRSDRETNIPIILRYSFHGMRLEYYTGVRVDVENTHILTPSVRFKLTP